MTRLEYTTSEGHSAFFEIDSDEEALDFRENGIKIIDLAPLTTCSNLFSLILSKNQLKEVDLSPIGALQDLKGLDLSANQLRMVDLRPLQYCNNTEIKLYGNPLKTILQPDSACANLVFDDPSK